MVRCIGKLSLEEPCGCVRTGSEAALPLFLLLAPAAAAVCLYLPPPQDTFGRRSVEIDTPFACEKRQLPTLSRAVSRAYANANHCESIHLHTAFAPANAAACAFGGHILTCCAYCSCRIEPTRQQGWDGGRGNCRERHGQATMQGSNNAGRRPDHNRGRAEQGSKVRADKHAPALPAPAEISIGDSAGRAAERRAPLSALRLSHADRSQFFTEVATV
jgi:hypothetical protein